MVLSGLQGIPIICQILHHIVIPYRHNGDLLFVRPIIVVTVPNATLVKYREKERETREYRASQS